MSKGSSATSAKSVQSAKSRLTKFLKTLDEVPVDELSRTAEAIKAKSIAQTPYKTGKLESSVYVRVSKSKSRPGLIAGASAKSQRGYDYAGIQHESTEFKHPIKGNAHFISGPFNEEIANMKKRIRRKLRYKDGS